MNDEGLLANGVSATERGETIAGWDCFVDDGGEKNEGLLIMGVSATEREHRTSAGRSCFGNENGGEKNDGVEEDEKMLISGVSASGTTDEGLLAIGVSATGKRMKGCWCFSNGKSCC
jgi:hypothetical protein